MRYYRSVFLAMFLLAGCGQPQEQEASLQQSSADPEPAETADAFVARINDELAELGRELGAAGWVRATYITPDTARCAGPSEASAARAVSTFMFEAGTSALSALRA